MRCESGLLPHFHVKVAKKALFTHEHIFFNGKKQTQGRSTGTKELGQRRAHPNFEAGKGKGVMVVGLCAMFPRRNSLENETVRLCVSSRGFLLLLLELCIDRLRSAI